MFLFQSISGANRQVMMEGEYSPGQTGQVIPVLHQGAVVTGKRRPGGTMLGNGQMNQSVPGSGALPILQEESDSMYATAPRPAARFQQQQQMYQQQQQHQQSEAAMATSGIYTGQIAMRNSIAVDQPLYRCVRHDRMFHNFHSVSETVLTIIY